MKRFVCSSSSIKSRFFLYFIFSVATQIDEISDDSDYTSDVSNSLKFRDESNENEMNSNRKIRRINEKSNSLTRDEQLSYVSQKKWPSNHHHQSIEQIHPKLK